MPIRSYVEIHRTTQAQRDKLYLTDEDEIRIIFNEDSDEFEYFDKGVWKPLLGAAGITTAQVQALIDASQTPQDAALAAEIAARIAADLLDEKVANKVTSIRASGLADDTSYPSEKAVRDAIDALAKGIGVWEAGKAYTANELFTFSTTNTTAVDINGNEIIAGETYIGKYEVATTSGGTLTNAEMLLIEIVSEDKDYTEDVQIVASVTYGMNVILDLRNAPDNTAQHFQVYNPSNPSTLFQVPTGNTLQVVADGVLTNGTLNDAVPNGAQGFYYRNGTDYTLVYQTVNNTENGDASNLNGAPQDLSANLLSLLPERVGWHFHVRQATTFTAGGALMNVTVNGDNAGTGVTTHTVPDGSQGFAIRVGTGYQVNYLTVGIGGISADADQKLTLGSDNLPYLGPDCTDVTEQFVTGATSNPGSTPPSGILVTEITVNKTQDITVVHTGTGFSGAAGSGWGIADAPMFATANSIAAANVYSSNADRIDSTTPSKTYTVSLTPGTYYIGVWSGGLSGVTSHTLDVSYCKPEVDVDVRFVETRCYEELGTALPVLDNDAFADEINSTQLATLPAGAHMRWTAPSMVTVDTLEVNGFNGTVTISWASSTGITGSQSVTFAGGVNPELLNLGGIALGTGETIDFTLDSISAGQMQLTTEATSTGNGWTALQDYSAFATTSHWATRLLTSGATIEHKVNVYEDTSGDTVLKEVVGDGLLDIDQATVDSWTLVACATPEESKIVDIAKYDAPGGTPTTLASTGAATTTFYDATVTDVLLTPTTTGLLTDVVLEMNPFNHFANDRQIQFEIFEGTTSLGLSSVYDWVDGNQNVSVAVTFTGVSVTAGTEYRIEANEITGNGAPDNMRWRQEDVASNIGFVFSDNANQPVNSSYTIEPTVCYSVVTETADDLTTTQYAVNVDDVTDRPDISGGIPNTWTLKEGNAIQSEDRQVDVYTMPYDSNTDSGYTGSGVPFPYNPVPITIDNTGKYSIEVHPFQSTTNLELGTRTGGLFELKDNGGTTVASIDFLNKNVIATYTNYPYDGGSQTVVIDDLAAGNYTLNFIGAQGEGAGNRNSSSGYVDFKVKYEGVKTAINTTDAPVNNTSNTVETEYNIEGTWLGNQRYTQTVFWTGSPSSPLALASTIDPTKVIKIEGIGVAGGGSAWPLNTTANGTAGNATRVNSAGTGIEITEYGGFDSSGGGHVTVHYYK